MRVKPARGEHLTIADSHCQGGCLFDNDWWRLRLGEPVQCLAGRSVRMRCGGYLWVYFVGRSLRAFLPISLAWVGYRKGCWGGVSSQCTAFAGVQISMLKICFGSGGHPAAGLWPSWSDRSRPIWPGKLAKRRPALNPADLRRHGPHEGRHLQPLRRQPPQLEWWMVPPSWRPACVGTHHWSMYCMQKQAFRRQRKGFKAEAGPHSA